MTNVLLSFIDHMIFIDSARLSYTRRPGSHIDFLYSASKTTAMTILLAHYSLSYPPVITENINRS